MSVLLGAPVFEHVSYCCRAKTASCMQGICVCSVILDVRFYGDYACIQHQSGHRRAIKNVLLKEGVAGHLILKHAGPRRHSPHLLSEERACFRPLANFSWSHVHFLVVSNGSLPFKYGLLCNSRLAYTFSGCLPIIWSALSYKLERCPRFSGFLELQWNLLFFLKLERILRLVAVTCESPLHLG